MPKVRKVTDSLDDSDALLNEFRAFKNQNNQPLSEEQFSELKAKFVNNSDYQSTDPIVRIKARLGVLYYVVNDLVGISKDLIREYLLKEVSGLPLSDLTPQGIAALVDALPDSIRDDMNIAVIELDGLHLKLLAHVEKTLNDIAKLEHELKQLKDRQVDQSLLQQQLSALQQTNKDLREVSENTVRTLEFDKQVLNSSIAAHVSRIKTLRSSSKNDSDAANLKIEAGLNTIQFQRHIISDQSKRIQQLEHELQLSRHNESQLHKIIQTNTLIQAPLEEVFSSADSSLSAVQISTQPGFGFFPLFQQSINQSEHQSFASIADTVVGAGNNSPGSELEGDSKRYKYAPGTRN